MTWVRTVDGQVQVMALDWEAAQAEPDQVEPMRVADLDTLDPDDQPRVQSWRGDPADESLLWVTTTAGDRILPVCLPEGLCPTDAGGSLGMEGGTVVDVDHLGTGITVALRARSQDGAARLELLSDPMSDTQRLLEVPEGTFPPDTRAPYDAWLAAAGDRVAVGFQGYAARLLTVSGDLAEDLRVTGSVELPEGTHAADVVGGGTG